MPKRRIRVPIRLLVSVVVLLALGAVSGPIIRANATEEQLARNVLLGAVPFILTFAAIVLVFITLISLAAGALNHNISGRLYRLVETITILGIVFGVAGMFQPWLFGLYRLGFVVLLFSTLSFILWSHITPKGVRRQAEDNGLSITEFEQGETEHG